MKECWSGRLLLSLTGVCCSAAVLLRWALLLVLVPLISVTGAATQVTAGAGRLCWPASACRSGAGGAGARRQMRSCSRRQRSYSRRRESKQGRRQTATCTGSTVVRQLGDWRSSGAGAGGARHPRPTRGRHRLSRRTEIGHLATGFCSSKQLQNVRNPKQLAWARAHWTNAQVPRAQLP